MSQGQLMYLLSEQQDAREQNYTLTRERSELIAELVRTRQHAEDLRVWASLKADDGEEKTGAGEATVGGLSQTSDLKWQLHLARGLCSQMHMACSEAVHEKEAIQAQCLEALQERDAYVAHASALHDHTEYLQRKVCAMNRLFSSRPRPSLYLRGRTCRLVLTTNGPAPPTLPH